MAIGFSGTQVTWVDGLPFEGVKVSGKSFQGELFWENGLPGEPVFDVDRTISVTGITSTEQFGTAQLNLHIQPSSINSAEQFGVNTIVSIVQPNSIDSTQAFGTPQLNLAIFESTFPSQETFGTLEIIPGPISIYPVQISSSEIVPSPDVISEIDETSIPSQEVFGTFKIRIRIHQTPNAIPSAQAFGLPLLSQKIQPAGINENVFGNPTILPGNIFVNPFSISSSQVISNPNIVSVISETSILSMESFGLPKISEIIKCSSITSLENVPSPSLVQKITTLGLVSGEEFGVSKIILYLKPSGIISDETFNSPTLTQTEPKLGPTGIISAAFVSAPNIVMIISPEGIESGEDFTRFDIYPNGISSGTVFGNTNVNLTIHATSINSGESFGIGIVYFQLISLDNNIHNGIPSEEAFGNHWTINHKLKSGHPITATQRSYKY